MDPRREDVDESVEKEKTLTFFSWLALWVDPENSFLNERLH